MEFGNASPILRPVKNNDESCKKLRELKKCNVHSSSPKLTGNLNRPILKLSNPVHQISSSESSPIRKLNIFKPVLQHDKELDMIPLSTPPSLESSKKRSFDSVDSFLAGNKKVSSFCNNTSGVKKLKRRNHAFYA